MSIRSRARSTRLLMVTLVSISLVTITLDFRAGTNGPLEGLGKASLTVITPMQRAASGITRPVGNFLGALAHLPSLESENRRLKDQLAQANTKIAESGNQAAQLADLQKLLTLKGQLGAAQTAGATVIGNSVSDFEWSITIDIGTSSGVHDGDAVLASAGIVGTIVRAGPISSQVQLIIDPSSHVAGRVGSTPPQQGLLDGEGPNDLRMGLLDRSVQPADLISKPVDTVSYIVGSGDGAVTNLYPPGVPIGTVTRALPSNGSSSPFVAVAPAVDFAELQNVLVVLSPTAG